MWTDEEIEAFEGRPRCCKCGDVTPLDTAVLGAGGLECSGCAPVCDDDERSE